MTFVTLKKGTVLFHGTDSKVSFVQLNGPSWLCLDVGKARQWAGWSETGRWAGGNRRVLTFVLKRNVRLVDTTSLEQWRELFSSLIKNPDPLLRQAAKAIARSKMSGWYGKEEILIAKPNRFLKPSGIAWKA